MLLRFRLFDEDGDHVGIDPTQVQVARETMMGQQPVVIIGMNGEQVYKVDDTEPRTVNERINRARAILFGLTVEAVEAIYGDNDQGSSDQGSGDGT